MSATSSETRLAEALAALQAHQTHSLSSAGQALVHLIETLTEEVLALRRDLQSLAAAPREASQAEVQLLRQRVAALEAELEKVRSSQLQLQSLRAPESDRASASRLPVPAHATAPVRPLEYWAENVPIYDLTPLNKEEALARLSRPRAQVPATAVSGKPDQGKESAMPAPVSPGWNMAARVVPVVAVVLLLLLAAVGVVTLFGH